MKKKFALISTYNKDGLIPLVDTLIKHNYTLIATSGTADFLKKNGLDVVTVEEITGFPSMLGGRVKTLHPLVFGGILAKGGEEEVKRYNIPLIDIVVVNLYPFDKEPSIENIDIGGISLIRAAGKNYRRLTCLTDPEDYDMVIKELNENSTISPDTRIYLARKAFALSTCFDTKVSLWLGSPELYMPFSKVEDLRYGENPHQKATLFRETGYKGISIIDAYKIQGKELSYNNICDLDTVLSVLCTFKETTVCILKHSSPCGIAVFPRLIDAYKRAKSCDPISSFGGIVGVNREVSGELAKELSSTFIEAVLAPSYNEEAKNILSKKKRLILLKLPLDCSLSTVSYRYINGGLIRQDSDNSLDNIKDYKVVSKRKPTKRELNAMNFAFNVVKFIKSNAVCITTDRMTVGIGGGQPNRVGALEIAIRNRKIFGFKDGIALASDGFFPFRDSIDLAAKEGIKAIIEPGGSIRDEEVIKAADEHNISLIFTGRRHFRH